MDESGINADSIVLEVGAGNGFFTEAIAQRAQKGYAVELQDGMIEKLRKRVGHLADTVEIMHGDIAELPIQPGSIDVCLLYYSFHEIGNQMQAASKITKAVRPGGMLAIYEPTVEVSRSAMERTVHIFEQAGFLRQTSRAGLFTRFVRMIKHQ